MALALGACYSANGTIVAAAASVAPSGMAARAGRPIGFLAFLRAGMPATIAALVLATATSCCVTPEMGSRPNGRRPRAAAV